MDFGPTTLLPERDWAARGGLAVTLAIAGLVESAAAARGMAASLVGAERAVSLAELVGIRCAVVPARAGAADEKQANQECSHAGMNSWLPRHIPLGRLFLRVADDAVPVGGRWLDLEAPQPLFVQGDERIGAVALAELGERG